MARTEGRRRVRAGLFIGIACWAALGAAFVQGLFHRWDLTLLDTKFRFRGERQAVEDIALVCIDDRTIRAYKAWGIERNQYALLLTALADAGAASIGVDLILPVDRNQHPMWNEMLAQVTKRLDNVVHLFWFSPGESEIAPAGGDPETLTRHGVPCAPEGLQDVNDLMVPYPALLEAVKRVGHPMVVIEDDGAHRRLPMWVRHADYCYPSLALAVYNAARGYHSVPRPLRQGSRHFIEWQDSTRTALPMDDLGATAIDFAGGEGAFPNTYSMLEVLNWSPEKRRLAFEGRTVLIGLTSPTEASADLGPTPFTAAAPLLYVHANALDNLFRGRFLSRPSPLVYLAGLLVLAVLLSIAMETVSLPIAAGMAVAATIVMAAGVQAALALGAVDVPTTMCLALPPAIYLASGSYRVLLLQRRTRDIEEIVPEYFLPESLIGKRIAGYLIEEQIGKGGMGVVYRAKTERGGRMVALKVLPLRKETSEVERKRFHRESQILSRLDHPNIARLIEYGKHPGIDYIAMEFVVGQTLEARLRKGALPERATLAITAQVCAGLAEAHRRGILHRDLKPANVMLASRDSVKLVDFGIARLTRADTLAGTLTVLTETGAVVGTVPYMAPETLQGEPADERTDIYGVGILLFETLTGVRPFRDALTAELVYKIKTQPPPKPRDLEPGISELVESIALRCLAKDRAERPESATALRAAILGAMGPPHTSRRGRTGIGGSR